MLNVPSRSSRILPTMSNANGFAVSVRGWMIPAAANPTDGSDMIVDATFSPQLPAILQCGDVTGELLAPVQLDLAGTTFRMVPVSDDLTQAPEPPPVDCRGTLADPV